MSEDVSYTLIGEGYWSLGIAGIIIMCGGMGYLLRAVEWRSIPGATSYLQVVIIKTFAAFMVSYIEAPHLGINSICIDIFTNLGILVLLSLPLLKSRREVPPISRTVLLR